MLPGAVVVELFAALLCAVRPFSGSPFPRPLVFIELVTGFVVWSAFAFVELGCFVRPVRAFVLSELPLLVTRSSPKKKKNKYIYIYIILYYMSRT